MKMKPKNYIFPAVVLIIFIGLSCYFIYRSTDLKSSLPVVKAAPDFELQNWNGENVSASVNRGKIVLMEFMFTSCPDICPLTTSKMVKLQEQLKQKSLFGEKVQFVAVTFDPEKDTPDVLRKYAERMNLDMAGWHVLRGDEKSTIEIAAKYGIMVQKMGGGQFAHSVTSLNLIDSQQRISKVYQMGDGMKIEEIMFDIETLLAEET